MQVYNLRELLEAEAAAQAAEARNAGDLVVLERLTARDHSLKDPDDATRRVTNLEFHAAIWAASHNAPLTDLLSRLAWHVPRTLRSTLSAPGRWADALDEHARIVEAIVARDSELARSLTRSHIDPRQFGQVVDCNVGPARDDGRGTEASTGLVSVMANMRREQWYSFARDP